MNFAAVAKRRLLGASLVALGALSGARGADLATDAPPRFTRVSLAPALVSVPVDPAGLGTGAAFTLWLHLHGAPNVVEAQFTASGARGVLVNVTLPGLSKIYADHFADDTRFAALLAATTDAVQRTHPLPARRLARVVVSSFSAGFGGVRQLLRQPAALARIDALVMADSIYCGYTGDPARRQVDPDLMAGFLRFAREAAEGRKQFVLSHSRQVPDGYASTTETADYLLSQLDLARASAATETWPGGLRPLTHARRGGFLVLGFDGEAPDDHMNHLRQLGALLARLTAPASTPTPR
ncbi:MAG: hypothetical protein JNL92_16625 [Opitutaceae bacterium]|nr:hypothetical protein [Opitutaceae bacterium]